MRQIYVVDMDQQNVSTIRMTLAKYQRNSSLSKALRNNYYFLRQILQPFSFITKSLSTFSHLSDKLIGLTKKIDFSELCITSGATIEKMTNNKKNQPKTVIVETIKAEGQKCPICWKININRCERHS